MSRTQEEIVARIEARKVNNPFMLPSEEVDVYICNLDFDHAKPYLRPDTTSDDWQGSVSSEESIKLNLAKLYKAERGQIVDNLYNIPAITAHAWMVTNDEFMAKLDAVDSFNAKAELLAELLGIDLGKS